jgi:hypothetical protein
MTCPALRNHATRTRYPRSSAASIRALHRARYERVGSKRPGARKSQWATRWLVGALRANRLDRRRRLRTHQRPVVQHPCINGSGNRSNGCCKPDGSDASTRPNSGINTKFFPENQLATDVEAENVSRTSNVIYQAG